MDVLSRQHGLPDLPISWRTILIGRKAPKALAAAMAAAIKDSADAFQERRNGV